MKRKKILIQFSILLLTFFMFSCKSIHKVNLVKTENDSKGEILYNVAYLSKVKKRFNHKDIERRYFVHTGARDSIFQLKNVVFSPENPDSTPSRKSSKKWFKENQYFLQMVAEVDQLEAESYYLYRGKLYSEGIRNILGKTDRQFAYQTHIFVDSISIKDNRIIIPSDSIKKAKLTAVGRGQDIILIASLITGLVIFVSLVIGSIKGFGF